MSTIKSSDTSLMITRYTNLKRVFIFGYALKIVLWFLPAVKVSPESFISIWGDDKILSMFSFVRLLSKWSFDLTMLMVLVFASNIVFIILAFKHPKRWIFLTGSSFTVFFLLMDMFSTSSNHQVHYLILPKILGYVTDAMTLTGFLIKPPLQEKEAEFKGSLQ